MSPAAALSYFPGKRILAWRPWKSQPQAGRQLHIAPAVRLRPSFENVTGVFFDRQTAEDLGDAIERFEQQEWCPDVIRRHSETFGIQVFRDRFRCFFRRIGTPVDIPDSQKVDSLVDALQVESAS